MVHDRTLRSAARQAGIYLLLAPPALAVLMPLFLVLLASIKNVTEAAVGGLTLPSVIRLDNFGEVLQEGEVGRAMVNGLIISVASIAIVISASSLAAFVLTRRETRVRHWIRLLLLLGLIAPLQVIPEVRIMRALHLQGSYLGVILIHSAVWMPLGVLLYSGAVKAIPRDLDEAAMIDGCPPIRMFYSIVFPLLRPMTATLTFLLFAGIWNDFQISLYFLGRQDMYTMPLTLFAFTGLHTGDMNLIAADIVMTLLPVVAVFLIAQRRIISALTTGGVHG